ncbi:MAG TPA: DUF4349 domain-containing protein [Gaiellaceae bacterium]|nr:DUF4349 domain-containing protein [Gaiellaceae bacterium]
MNGYEALVSELRASPPVAPERLRQRVLEGAPAPRRQRSRKRRLALVVVPAAVVLALGAALVHGFVSSGSRNAGRPTLGVVSGVNRQTEHQVAKAVRTTPAAAAPDRELAPLTKSKSFQSYNLDQKTTASSGSAVLAGSLGSVERSLSIPKNRLVHAVASLQVGVKGKDLSAKTNDASQIVGSFGGYAQSVRYQHSRNGYGNAVLELRVPVQNAQAAIAKLGGLGTLLSQQVSTQDLQAKVTGQTNAIGSLRRAIAVYENALQSSTLSATERVAIQIKLNNARHALARLRHARNATQALGATADISLLLTTQNHAIVPAHHHGSTRIGRLLGSAAHFLALEGIIVLYALIVLAPFLLLGGLGWWILRERRRREERLLASA